MNAAIQQSAGEYSDAKQQKLNRLKLWETFGLTVEVRLNEIRNSLAQNIPYFQTAKVIRRPVTYVLGDIVFEDQSAQEVVFMSGNLHVQDLQNGQQALTRFESGFEVRFFPQFNGIINMVVLGHQLRDVAAERPAKVIASFDRPDDITQKDIDDGFLEALQFAKNTTHIFHEGYDRENGWEVKVSGFRRSSDD